MFTEPLPADSKLVVSNALYFNGSWEYEFLYDPPSYVGIDANFTSFDRNISLTMMTSDMDFPYLRDEDLGIEIASLPYKHFTRGSTTQIARRPQI